MILSSVSSFDRRTILLATSAFGILTSALSWWWVKVFRRRWKTVGTIDKIYIYPLKSGKAKEVPMADFGPMGIKAGPFVDRSFMVIDGR